MAKNMAERKLGDFVSGKTYIFIDAANIFYAQRSLGWRISYQRLIQYLKREVDFGKAFVYIGTIPGNEKQKKFLDLLDILGYIVRTKPIKVIVDDTSHKHWKSNFDIELALEMIDTLGSYDSAILVSGNSDFAPVIDRVKQAGKRIVVISTRGHISIELLERAKYLDLKKLRSAVEMVKKIPRLRGGGTSLESSIDPSGRKVKHRVV